jgi:hypothetical protein
LLSFGGLLREHCLVAFHDKLMSTGNQLDVIDFVEFGYNITAEQVAGAAGRETPALNVLRVTPHEVTHGALVRNFLLAVDHANLVQGVDCGGQTTMDAEDLVVDDSGQAEVIKNLSAVSPYIDGAVFTEALVIKAINLRNLTRFVVATNEGDSVRVSHLSQ